PHVGGAGMRTGRPHSGIPCSLGFGSPKLGPHPVAPSLRRHGSPRLMEIKKRSGNRSARLPRPKGTGLSWGKDPEGPWAGETGLAGSAGFSRLSQRQTGRLGAVKDRAGGGGKSGEEVGVALMTGEHRCRIAL